MKRAGALVLGTALACGAAGAAFAQGSTPVETPRQRLSDDVFQAVAEATGLSVDEVWAEVYDGRTLAEVAEARGADPEAIVSDVTAQVSAEISAASADGSLTEAQAERLLARLPDALDRAMYFTHAGPRAGVRVAVGGVHQLIASTADATGLSRLEIWQALDDGQTLADLAAANGSSADDVIAAALAATSDRLDTAVERGRLSDDQASVLRDRAAESYASLVNETLPGWRLPARVRADGLLRGRLGPGRFVY
jgi:hypothetical protein